jgi:hypothetical protein
MHGVVLAAVLRPVMEFNADLGRASYAAVADAIGVRLSWWTNWSSGAADMVPDIAAATVAAAVTVNSPRLPESNEVSWCE